MPLRIIRKMAQLVLIAGLTGCIPLHRHRPATLPSTEPTTMESPATAPVATSVPPVIIAPPPTTEPVATQDLATTPKIPGLSPRPKPFIAVPKSLRVAMARPSQLLLMHASPDSPVPLSEYGNQPVYSVSDFHLRKGLSAGAVQKKMGQPAQLADTEDPWLVYRLTGDREIWLHFSTGTDSEGMVNLVLDAADVIRGAEDGYVRDRVFSAD